MSFAFSSGDQMLRSNVKTNIFIIDELASYF